MRLLHLSAVGTDQPPASLEFAPRLTVIYGASEAGKSYVIEAIDFVLGAAALRELPEAEGYQTMLLGIELRNGSTVTLARNLRGGRIRVYNQDLRTAPTQTADRTLLGKHDNSNPENISQYLLDELGIAGTKLRKNTQNKLQVMSFRQVAHLTLIQEEGIQSQTRPVETGRSQSRTAERAAFKLMLEGEDDSDLVEGDDPTAFRRLNRAQLQVLDRAITQASAQLKGVADPAQCTEMLARVNAAIIDANTALGDHLVRKDVLLVRRQSLEDEQRQVRERLGEASALSGRFSLLDAQYAADLARLQLVRETGTLLGYFETEKCVFCGADSAHQDRNHAVYETNELRESIDTEATRTQALKDDLALTLAAVQADLTRSRQQDEALIAQLRENANDITEMETSLAPAQHDMGELLTRRSQLEAWLSLWSHVGELEALRGSVSQEEPILADDVTHGVSLRTQEALSRRLRDVLTRWQLPGASESAFTFSDAPAIIMQGRERESRGKGMRSVLHAAFSIALSEYCNEYERPHPGFVALDTPVLTYRDHDRNDPIDADSPDVPAGLDSDLEGPGTDEASEELLSSSVAEAFYQDLAYVHSGQSIVLENQTPPAVAAADCSIVYFTGNPTVGRAGFYPPLN